MSHGQVHRLGASRNLRRFGQQDCVLEAEQFLHSEVASNSSEYSWDWQDLACVIVDWPLSIVSQPVHFAVVVVNWRKLMMKVAAVVVAVVFGPPFSGQLCAFLPQI